MRSIQTGLFLGLVAAFCASTRCSVATRAAEPTSVANSGEIAIRATNAAGVPQADAVVSLFRYDSDSQSYITKPRDEKTDSSGEIRFTQLAVENSYFVQAKTCDGLVGCRQCDLLNKTVRQDVDLTVLRPIAATIHVHDELGKALQGASIRLLKHTGPNGTVWLWRESRPLISAFGHFSPSDANGNLALPELPGGKIDFALKHPSFAPATLSGVTLDKNIPADATLSRGVALTMRFNLDTKSPPLRGFLIDLTHEPDEHPSTFRDQLTELCPNGVARLTVAPGKYSSMRLTHSDYIVTPEYLLLRGHGLADEPEFFELKPGNEHFTFQLHRKVKVRGRVLDETGGKPVANIGVDGYLPSGAETSPLARFAKDWSRAGSASTNDKGEFELDLAAGPARLWISGRGYISVSPHYSLDVAPDGSTAAPDIFVRPVPKVRGVVQDQNGQALSGAIIRFRGSLLTYACQPTVADANGRFELSPPWVPTDFKTLEPQPEQTVVAYHPYKPLGAEIRIHMDNSTALGNVVLQMKPQDYGTQVTGYPEGLTPFQRGVIPPDQKDHLAAISLIGKPAPELDGAAWLNSDKPKMTLADFRGKFVLLQFWATWCGPCHREMPSVKLAYDLYKNRGFVVIGVHDNSMPLDAIKEDVVRSGLSYPVVVDNPDGRIFARYKEHGMATAYPTYALIGPDGNVMFDDATVARPTLQFFKGEIIRQLVMSRQKDDHSP